MRNQTSELQNRPPEIPARVTTVFGGRKNIKELEVKGGNGLVETKGGKVTILLSKERLASGHIELSKLETFKSNYRHRSRRVAPL